MLAALGFEKGFEAGIMAESRFERARFHRGIGAGGEGGMRGAMTQKMSQPVPMRSARRRGRLP